MRIYCPDIQRTFRLTPKETRQVRKSWFLESPTCLLSVPIRAKPLNRLKAEQIWRQIEEEAIRKAMAAVKKERSVQELHNAYLAGEELSLVEYLMGKYEVESNVIRIGLTYVDLLSARLEDDSNGQSQALQGRKILDLGCGSKVRFEHSFYSKEIKGEYSPWLCRALHRLGAEAHGIDLGTNDGEDFFHHEADLSRRGVLRSIFDDSHNATFDAITMVNFIQNLSPLLESMTNKEQRTQMKREIFGEAKRLLKEGGWLINDGRFYRKMNGNIVHIRN